MIDHSPISVLHILPGPVYYPEDMLGRKYAELSKFSRGSIVSISDDGVELDIANFRVRLVETKGKYGLIINLKLFLATIVEAVKLRRKGKIGLVVCYDPLKTGLMGFFIKCFFRCKLIVEVNGVYESSVLYENTWREKLKRQVYKFIQRVVLKNAGGIKQLFEGQVSADMLSKKTHLATYFDYTQIEPGEYLPVSTKKILTIGFPVKVKGIDILIEAFNEIKNKFPDWSLHIVGHYSKPDRDWFDAQNLDASISICPPVPFAEIGALVDDCDIFVLASRTEAMGRVLLEAMARGKARIGSRVDGIPTVINDDVDGLLVDVADKLGLSEALESLMKSESKREEFALAGLERFSKEFNIDSYAGYTKQLYQAVSEG